MDHGKFGKSVLDRIQQSFPGSSFRQSDSEKWLDIDKEFNIRLERNWRDHPKSWYLILFKDAGAGYILELDLSLAVENNGRYTWFLKPPVNKKTLQVLEKIAGPRQEADQQYRESVGKAKRALGQPAQILRQGYRLVVGEDFQKTVDALLSLFRSLVRAHGGNWAVQPRQRKVSSSLRNLLDDLEEGVKSALSDPTGRKRRLKTANPKPKQVTVSTTVFRRNPDVIAEVLVRASGKCEDCERSAPFRRRTDDSPYLEVHHRTQLSVGGEDTIKNAIALCPNCHKKAHYA